VVSSTPRPHFTPGKDPVPIVQEAGWAPGPVWTGGKSPPHLTCCTPIKYMYFLTCMCLRRSAKRWKPLKKFCSLRRVTSLQRGLISASCITWHGWTHLETITLTRASITETCDVIAIATGTDMCIVYHVTLEEAFRCGNLATRYDNRCVGAECGIVNGGGRGDKEKNTSVRAQINQYCSGRGSCCVLL